MQATKPQTAIRAVDMIFFVTCFDAESMALLRPMRNRYDVIK